MKSSLKQFLALLALACGFLPGPARADDAPAAAETKTEYDFIADGTKRIPLKGGDFSITPPAKWEVYTHHPSLTLLMQVPYKAGIKYQRTIQVASFAGSRYIDEVTAKEYEEVIVRKFSVASASLEDFRVRNHMVIEMADGRQGLLFYTEFVLDGVPLMQAHILVSSAGRHYLMTFTDVAEHFENEAAAQFLSEAWDSMISVQLATATPARFQSMAAIGIGAGVLALLGLVIVGVRSMRSGRSYRDFANGKDMGDDVKSGVSQLNSEAAVSMTTGVSRFESAKTAKPMKRQPPKPDTESKVEETGDDMSFDDDDVAV